MNIENIDLLRIEDLVNNPTPRVPVSFCLDTSSSMYGSPIDELNEGVKLFYDAIKADDVARYSAEISIVTFGNNGFECIKDFSSFELEPNPPTLSTGGYTPMGEGVNLSLDLLEKRKKEYKDKGVDYFQPWLVLMTDGGPNGDISELNRAISRTVDMVNHKKITVFPIGIGSSADMNVLAKFSPNRTPLKLKGLNFRNFFEWLSKSVSKTSHSMPGETFILYVVGINGCADL